MRPSLLAILIAVLLPAATLAQSPAIVAHRGAVLQAPENTLPAIERAVALKTAIVEIDLRYTKDGEVVLLHDETLERTSNGRGKVSETALVDLKALDAGSWFDGRYAGTRIPTLREVIQSARGKIDLYLDLKEADPLPVVRVVQEMKAESMVYFRPYSYQALRKILRADSRFKLLLDLEDWMQMPGILPLLYENVPTAAFSTSLRNWTPAMLDEARKLGVKTFVNVLGEEDTEQNLREAVQIGFDFIQTDRQELLGKLLAEARTRR